MDSNGKSRKEGKALRIGRTVAALYLALYGVLGLLNLPVISDPLLDYLRTTYPNITWFSDPHPIAHMFLCPVAIVSAVGILRRRQWALWLGTVVLVMEIPFATHVLARSMWYDRHSSALLYQIDGFTVAQEQPTLRHFFVIAFLCSVGFNAFFVFLLRPWRRWRAPVTQGRVTMKTTKTNKFQTALPLVVFAGFVVMAYLGFRGGCEETKEGKDATRLDLEQKASRPTAYTSESLRKEKERLRREIERLRRENAKLSKEILEESLEMEFFVNSEESDALIRRFDNDLATALPILRSMLSGAKRSKMDAIICLGKMGSKSQANGKVAMPLLREVLQNDEGIVRALAATMLTRLGEKIEAIPILLETLTNRPDAEELLCTVGGLMEAKTEVKDKAALSILKESLTHEEHSIVIFSARILVNSHCYNEVIPPMLNMLRSPQRDRRYSAATIFWIMGPNAKSALPALKAAQLTETDSEVRVTLMLAIAAIGGS